MELQVFLSYYGLFWSIEYHGEPVVLFLFYVPLLGGNKQSGANIKIKIMGF
jgi:hypothetical protein